MALRASERAKTAAAREGGAKSRASGSSRAFPLDLLPLIQPYKKHGRLSLRVERMQQRARLSRGRNNGDGSWSLASDELEDLEYLAPEEGDTAHSLSIRLIGLSQGGVTLAILDVPISADGEKSGAEKKVHATTVAVEEPEPDRKSEARGKRHQEELEELKAALAERDAELEGLRKTIAQSQEESAQKTEATIADMQESLKREFGEKLAAAEAKSSSSITDSKRGWEAEKSALLSEARRLSDSRLGEARERWRKDTEDARAKAEADWKAAEQARFSKAEAEWRDKSAKATADANAKIERAQSELAEAKASALSTSDRVHLEQDKLREELKAARTAVSERDSELERIRAAVEAAKADAKASAEALSDRERNESEKVQEDLAKARATISERDSELARALAALAEARNSATSKRDEKEYAQLSEELVAIRAALAVRDDELSHTRDALEQAQISAESAHDEKEYAQLNEELSGIRAALAVRDDELDRLRSGKDQGQKDLDATISKTKAEWKDAELARFDLAEKEWRKQSSEALTRANARAEDAEKALVRVRAEAKTGAESVAIVRRLHGEITALQIALADRESELAQARQALGTQSVPPQQRISLRDDRITLRDDQDWGDVDAREAREKSKTYRLIRDVFLLILLSVSAFLLWPSVEARIPESWWNMVGLTVQSANNEKPHVAPPRHAPSAPVRAEPTATIVRGVNMRAEPVKTAAVVATLAKGAAVVVLEQRSNWTHIRVDSNGKSQDGWVYSSFLSGTTPESSATK